MCVCVHFTTDNICRCRLAITCIELYSSVEADAILWIVITIARRMTKPFKKGSSRKGKVFWSRRTFFPFIVDPIKYGEKGHQRRWQIPDRRQHGPELTSK